MILSPVKCFIIQLTLAFVVFFDNTLATSHEDWCENEINNIDIPLRDNARVLCKYFLTSFLAAKEEKQKSLWESLDTIKNCLEIAADEEKPKSYWESLENFLTSFLAVDEEKQKFADEEKQKSIKNCLETADEEKRKLAADEEKPKSYWESLETIKNCLETSLQKAIEDLTDAKLTYIQASKGYDKVFNSAVFKIVFREAYKAASTENIQIADKYAVQRAAQDAVYSAVDGAVEEAGTSSFISARFGESIGGVKDLAFTVAKAAYDAVYFDGLATYNKAKAANNAAKAANNAVKAAYNAAYIAAVDHFGLVCIVKYSEFIKKGKSPSNILS